MLRWREEDQSGGHGQVGRTCSAEILKAVDRLSSKLLKWPVTFRRGRTSRWPHATTAPREVKPNKSSTGVNKFLRHIFHPTKFIGKVCCLTSLTV